MRSKLKQAGWAGIICPPKSGGQTKNRLPTLQGLMLALCGLLMIGMDAMAADKKLIETGKKIYREGILGNGQPLQSSVQGGAGLSGAQVACVQCHRRSGLGSVEGTSVVLPVTGTALYAPGPAGLWQKFGYDPKGNKTYREAYTDQTLAKAIREGITPSGRELQTLMPRFTLPDGDMKALTAYLKTLQNAPSPGVDDDILHLATVITPDVPPEQRKALRDVLDAYAKDKNAGLRHEGRRRETSKEVMYTSFRGWDVQTWELQGPPDTWGKQLDAKFAKQPVFALISGLGNSTWAPVDAFCERHEVACLFPNIALPVADTQGYFTVYFSRGLSLEADALGAYASANPASMGGPILQVGRDTALGKTPAEALKKSLDAAGRSDNKSVFVGKGQALDAGAWGKLIEAEHPATLVAWLGKEDLAGLIPHLDKLPSVVLSATLLDDDFPESLTGPNDKVHIVSTWDDPATRRQRAARAEMWLKSRQIALTDPVMQTNSFWTLMMLGDATKHLAGNFSAAYLVERIEQMTESVAITSLYPRLSLAPGQRYAAKTARLFKLGPQQTWVPESDWISP